MGACLDDELLAALLDGRLAPVEREAAEAHLADCAPCRELFGATARFLADGAEARPVPRVAGFRLLRLALPVAAALLLAVGLLRFQPAEPAVRPSGPSGGPLGSPGVSGAAGQLLSETLDTARLEEGSWFEEGSAYGFAPESDGPRAAVLLGAFETDRRLAQRAGQTGRAEHLAGRIAGLRQSHGALDPQRTALGEWLEAARLAALARDPRFLADPRLHAALAQPPADLGPAGAEALARAQGLLAASPQADADWRRLASALQDALLLL